MCKNNSILSKEAVRRKIEDVQRVNILRGARNETWELVDDRVASELSRTSTSLSERLTGLERMVQSQNAWPATAVDQHQAGQETFEQLKSRIEARLQAFLHEADQLR